MSESRRVVPGFTVTPRQLHEARAQQDALAETVEEVARAVRGLDVPSGRPDTAHGCGELLRRLSLVLEAGARSTRSAGVAVAAAGTLYSVTDAAAVP